jgi:hypothetical protein
VHLVTLTRAQAERCWKGTTWGGERVFLTAAELFLGDELVADCFCNGLPWSCAPCRPGLSTG